MKSKNLQAHSCSKQSFIGTIRVNKRHLENELMEAQTYDMARSLQK